MTSKGSSPRGKGHHVLMALSGFFGVMFIVNGIFVDFASRPSAAATRPTLTEKASHYNEALADAERARPSAGWRTDVGYDGKRWAASRKSSRQGGGATVEGCTLRFELHRRATEQGRPPYPPEGSVASGSMKRMSGFSPGLWVIEMASREADEGRGTPPIG